VKPVRRDPTGRIIEESYRFGQSKTGTWHYVPELIKREPNPFIGTWLTRCGRNVRVSNVRDDQPPALLTCSTCYRHI